MPTMDTLLSMKVFRQVVESGSFVGAAERLSLSTAMTSKHLMHLKKHLGTRVMGTPGTSLARTAISTSRHGWYFASDHR
jgi:DNA-binding transcriptional LysR family regulator